MFPRILKLNVQTTKTQKRIPLGWQMPTQALGGRVGVTATDLQFVCRTSDVSSAAEGDALVTGSVNYTIRDVIDDGTSMTTLTLEAD
ncbi:MAG TPA: hypothetical protein EYM99_00820 [Alphaproteobacteria bacterium]|nr:hypothetical protein [Alphaproteobacteria bacterium]